MTRRHDIPWGDNHPHVDDDPGLDRVEAWLTRAFILIITVVMARLLVQAVTGR